MAWASTAVIGLENRQDTLQQISANISEAHPSARASRMLRVELVSQEWMIIVKRLNYEVVHWTQAFVTCVDIAYNK